MIKGLSFKGVKKITDTTGFEPLDVKIKRFMLSGEIARLHSSQFDSYDLREMFSNVPAVEYDGDEDIEETREKISILMAKRQEILARKKPATPGNLTDEALASSGEEESEKESSVSAEKEK